MYCSKYWTNTDISVVPVISGILESLVSLIYLSHLREVFNRKPPDIIWKLSRLPYPIPIPHFSWKPNNEIFRFAWETSPPQKSGITFLFLIPDLTTSPHLQSGKGVLISPPHQSWIIKFYFSKTPSYISIFFILSLSSLLLVSQLWKIRYLSHLIYSRDLIHLTQSIHLRNLNHHSHLSHLNNHHHLKSFHLSRSYH